MAVAQRPGDPGAPGNAARAFLGKRAGYSPAQRTAEAEVIVQEAASRAWDRRDRLDGSKDVVKWLVGFVINVSREFAKNRARGGIDRPPALTSWRCWPSTPLQPIEDALADRLLAEQLLARLPQLDRQVVAMKFYEEMTCAEISQRIGTNAERSTCPPTSGDPEAQDRVWSHRGGPAMTERDNQLRLDRLALRVSHGNRQR